MTSTSTNCAPNSTTCAEPEKKGGRTPREERIIAGFEEIQRFVEQHGRAPQHGEDRDIFERLYAVRLDRLRALEECRALLAPLDRQGLLAGAKPPPRWPCDDDLDDDELAGRAWRGAAGAADITELRHVRTGAEKRAAEEIANRQKCEDFEQFKPLFEQVQKELESRRPPDAPVRAESGNSTRAVGSSSAARRPMSRRRARHSPTRRAARTRGCA